jgi:hypothetical protein
MSASTQVDLRATRDEVSWMSYAEAKHMSPARRVT